MINDKDTLNFTRYSENEFYNSVDMEAFYDKDSEIIYEHLKNRTVLIPFGNYLKRYIFQKAGFSGDYRTIDLKEYQTIIIESFEENKTPPSFVQTTAKLSALSKNWLTQSSVNRNVVFLLGFGLHMRVEDVSNFLLHALNERDFNFKSPFEVICWYCFKHGYRFSKFIQLIDLYRDLPYKDRFFVSAATVDIRDMFRGVETEEELLRCLAQIKAENAGQFFSVTANDYFLRLYEKTKTVIAQKYNEDSQAEADRKAKEYFSNMENSILLTFDEKLRQAAKIRKSAKKFSANDITEADVEKFLCCGVPFDRKGNLQKYSLSTLAKHFSSKRMSRQHIYDILTKRVGVDRFDLITLNFFIIAMDERIENNKSRFFYFTETTNRILEDCSFGGMYIANPYECFLQMCMLSDWPMGAYADVLEKSYEQS